MTVLRNTVTEPDGSVLSGWLDVALLGSPFRAATQTEVLGPIKDRQFTGGAWSVELVPGLYVVTQRRQDGAFHSRWTAEVPDSASPVWLADCLVEVPTSPAAVPLLGVASAVVDGAGHLQVTYTDGTTVDAGPVVGPQGPPWTGSATEFGQAVADEIVDQAPDRLSPIGMVLGETFEARIRFNVRAFGAVLDGTTDDTAAVLATIAAASALPASTLKEIYFPPGVCKIATAVSAAGLSWALSITADNVTLSGAGAASIIRNTTASASTLILGGCGKPEGHAQWLKYSPWRFAGDTFASGTAITPASPLELLPMAAAARGANSVTLTTPADAADLAAGDIVVIRSGQVVVNAGNWNAEPDSEYNVVVSANSGTGVVVLERPLAKPYVQEYQSAVGQTSSTTTAAVTVPMGLVKATSITQRNVAIENLRFESTGTGPPIRVRGIVDGYRETNVQIDCNGLAQDLLEYRDALFQNVHAVMRGTSRADLWPLTIAVGCTDITIENLTGIATDVTACLHIHEGSARVRGRGVTLMSGPSATVSREISIRSRAYDVDIDDYLIVGGGTGNAVIIGSDCQGGGRLGRGTVRKPSMTERTVLVQAANWEIAPPLDGRGGDVQIEPSVRAPQVAAEIRVLSGWVSDDAQTQVLGIMPAQSIIIGAGVHVYETFNSDGSDLINIGSSGSPSDIVSGVDVSTPFNKTVAVGAAMGYRDAAMTVQASYVNGGSEPTTGKALVWVQIATAPTHVA